ncbi:hypothetical protein C8R43DRAFT_154560 [Mycena crocata]|nr:hypothetical protein C8R43DRAFT_154560 [Mycena crocata]
MSSARLIRGLAGRLRIFLKCWSARCLPCSMSACAHLKLTDRQHRLQFNHLTTPSARQITSSFRAYEALKLGEVPTEIILLSKIPTCNCRTDLVV